MIPSFRDFIRNVGFQAAVLAVLGFLLVYWVFSGQDIASLWEKMTQAEFRFLGLAIFISGIGHVARAMRWVELFDPAESRPRVSTAFAGLMLGYLVNFAIPRLGELTRSGVLLRMDHVPLLRSIGTVVIERSLDVLVLFALLGIAVLVAGDALMSLIEAWIILPIGGWVASNPGWLGLVGVLILGIGVVAWIFRRRLSDKARSVRSSSVWVREIVIGLRGVLRIRNRFGFLGMTAGIWLSYWSGPALTLMAMGMWREDGLVVSFAMFTMGSLARTIPLPAGSMGPYHFVVSQVLIGFGFDAETALAAATLNHATQTAFYFMAGSLSALALPWLKPVSRVTEKT